MNRQGWQNGWPAVACAMSMAGPPSPCIVVGDARTHHSDAAGTAWSAPAPAVSDTLVDAACVEAVVAENTRTREDIQRDRVHVISAFATPKFMFDPLRKSFHRDMSQRSLFAGAAAKVAVYRERLALAAARLARHPAFASSASAVAAGGDAAGAAAGQGAGIHLTAIESLPTKAGESVYVLGMLCAPDEVNGPALEDWHGRVPLLWAPDMLLPFGMFTEGAVVVVEGVYDPDAKEGTGALVVHVMGHPPVESRPDACVALGVPDPMCELTTVDDYREAEAAAAKEVHSSVAVFNDVALDDVHVLDRLRHVLSTLVAVSTVPDVLVLCGPFLSHAFGAAAGDKARLKQAFDGLADMLAAIPAVAAGSLLVLVPAQTDAGCGSVLPRLPLPAAALGKLTDTVRKVEVASNPTRLRWFTQELVFFRSDIGERLRKSALISATQAGGNASYDYDYDRDGPVESVPGLGAPGAGQALDDDDAPAALDAMPHTDAEDAGKPAARSKSYHVAATLVHQAHLCPLPMLEQPVYWDHDHALRLWPPPDLLFMCESHRPWHEQVEGVQVVSPGSFTADGRFVLYSPATRQVQPSQV